MAVATASLASSTPIVDEFCYDLDLVKAQIEIFKEKDKMKMVGVILRMAQLSFSLSLF